MRKEYISPAIKLLVIDELCTMKYGSVVSGESDVVIDGFDVSEDTPDKGDENGGIIQTIGVVVNTIPMTLTTSLTIHIL